MLYQEFSQNCHFSENIIFRKIWSKEESQRIYIHGKVLKANAKTFIETYHKEDVIERVR